MDTTTSTEPAITDPVALAKFEEWRELWRRAIRPRQRLTVIERDLAVIGYEIDATEYTLAVSARLVSMDAVRQAELVGMLNREVAEDEGRCAMPTPMSVAVINAALKDLGISGSRFWRHVAGGDMHPMPLADFLADEISQYIADGLHITKGSR